MQPGERAKRGYWRRLVECEEAESVAQSGTTSQPEIPLRRAVTDATGSTARARAAAEDPCPPRRSRVTSAAAVASTPTGARWETPREAPWGARWARPRAAPP